MNPDVRLSDDERRAVDAFRARHKAGVLALFFSDVVGSTELKQRLGDAVGSQMIQRQRSLIRGLLASFAKAEEISTAGDSFFIVFVNPSDAVGFALQVQNAIRQLGDPNRGITLEIRIGLHMGQVFVDEEGEGALGRDVLGLQVDIAARVMSLAAGGQILVTRGVFDNARAILRGEMLERVGPLSWIRHGPYPVKGVEGAVELCEVGEVGLAPLRPPGKAFSRARRAMVISAAALLVLAAAGVGIFVFYQNWENGSEPRAAGFPGPSQPPHGIATSQTAALLSGSPEAAGRQSDSASTYANAPVVIYRAPAPDLKRWQADIDLLRKYLSELGSDTSPLGFPIPTANERNMESMMFFSCIMVCRNGLSNFDEGKYFSARGCFSQTRMLLDEGQAKALEDMKARGKITFSAKSFRDCLDRLSTVGAPDAKDFIPIYFTVARADGTFMGVAGAVFADEVLAHAESDFLSAEIPVKRWPHKGGSRYTCEITYTLGQRGEYSNLPVVPLPSNLAQEREGLVCTAQYKVKISDNNTGKTVLEFEDSGEYRHTSSGINLARSREELAKKVFSPTCFKLEEHFAVLRSDR